MKSFCKIIFVFFILASLFTSTNPVYSQLIADGPNDYVSLYFFIDTVNSGNLRTEFRMETNVSLNTTKEKLPIFIENRWINEEYDINKLKNETEYYVYLKEEDDSDIIQFYSEQTLWMSLFGDKSTYPYDSYKLDLSVRLPFTGLTENKVSVFVPSCSPTEWDQRSETLDFTLDEDNDYSYVKFQIILDRATFDRTLFDYLFIPFYVLIGGIYLLNTRENNEKVGYYLTLFLTVATSVVISFADYMPPKAGYTIFNALIQHLTFTITMFFLVDILLVARPEYSDNLIIWWIATTIPPWYTSWFLLITWNKINSNFAIYDWVPYPWYLHIFISGIMLFFYTQKHPVLTLIYNRILGWIRVTLRFINRPRRLAILSMGVLSVIIFLSFVLYW